MTRLVGAGLLVTAAAYLASALTGHHPPAAATEVAGYGSSAAAPLPAAGTGANRSFYIYGSVGGLWPGRSQSLTLTVSNPGKAGIIVTSITTTVGDATAGCAAANLQVGTFSGSLAVTAGGLSTAMVTATMPATAPDGCQGAVFPLQYLGQGHGT